MNSIISLEELIKQEENQIALQQKQLAAHESGEVRLSRLALASTETKLEEAQTLIAKHKQMLEKLQKVDESELEEKENTLLAVKRKKYFEEQNIRIKNSNEKSDDHKLEAMMILEELPNGIEFEDEDIFEIASKSLELHLGDLTDLQNRLLEIKSDFENLIKHCKDEKISEIGLLNERIPIIVLHFSVLLENIKANYIKKEVIEDIEKDEESVEENTEKNENVEKQIKEKEIQKEESPKEEEKLPKFNGFPKYEDWWIKELWSSHQAYFALYKFKGIINNFCKTGEQKRSWSKIFDNWVSIKKLLSDKGELAHDYQYAFDSLLFKYAELEEELENKNLESMEIIIQRITKNEDFGKVMKGHNIVTDYLKFKRDKKK